MRYILCGIVSINNESNLLKFHVVKLHKVAPSGIVHVIKL